MHSSSEKQRDSKKTQEYLNRFFQINLHIELAFVLADAVLNLLDDPI